MRKKAMNCEREPEIVRALAAGSLPAQLREHLAACPACSEAALVSDCLRQTMSEEEATVTPAGLAWWKAQLRLRREAEERATRPLVWAEGAAAALVLAAGAGAAVWLAAGSSIPVVYVAAGVLAVALPAGCALLVAHSRK